ncbi:NADP-dependent oxidoreductase [Corynebacterium sp. S1S1]|uniref:NADP-dependent oxidoreductase n=1 Tax=Corynebacterium sp. S1S1 TaxID=1881619 RepID=UPI000AC25324|nr:NADP-dependent oxidoreductase [Corynebacterium sp. S1S1]
MTSTDASSTTELPTTTQQWVLASRPTGLPTDESFRLETVDLPELNDGDILVANSVATVDPYMRGRMNGTKSYVPPFQLDQPMTGGAVGTVLASKSDKFQVGDAVRHSYGWQTNAVIADSEATPVDLNVAPAAAYLGILGLTGLTAYVGLTAVGEMKEGDVVFISGAAGAVGSAAGQFAKQMGASRVIGSAGSDEKVERLLELGFDAAFNYNDGPVAEQLAQAAPEGIDFYFDNVGGDHLEAAIGAMRTFGRVAMCGAISQYNNTGAPTGPRNLALAIGKCITLRGFVLGKYLHLAGEFQERMAPLVVSGKVAYDVTTRHGIENMPAAFLELFSGGNTGKMVVEF